MQLKSIKEMPCVPSNCISVDSHDKLFSLDENMPLTHNSVLQQNIIFSCLLRPEYWVLLGIDLKRVELTRFRQYGVKVAVEVDTAVEFLRFAQAVMMKRYERMEECGVNNFMNLPEKTQALMVMIDEFGELSVPLGIKTEEGKMIDELKSEACMIVGSIARLGRAAGVHIVIATQQPRADIIASETRDNLGVRIGCGPLKPAASTMLLNSGIGQRIHAKPQGGIYVQIHGHGNMAQGFYAPDDWLDKYIEKNGTINGASDSVGNETLPSEQSGIIGNKGEQPIETWDDEMEDIMALE